MRQAIQGFILGNLMLCSTLFIVNLVRFNFEGKVFHVGYIDGDPRR